MTVRPCIFIMLPLAALLMVSHPARAGSGNPCTGPTSMLSLLNRPTVADSACVARPGDLVIEEGYKNQVSHNPGFQRSVTYPNGLLRFGLPGNWEIDLFPPSYNRRTTRSVVVGDDVETGFGDVTVGAKHEFGLFGPFVLAADTKISAPSGVRPFTNGAADATVNGIMSYKVTQNIGLALQIGASSLTSQMSSGRIRRFTILEPDMVLKYHFSSIPLQFYAEAYRGSGIGGAEGSYSFDGGIQYLIAPWWEIDAEADTLLSGPAGARANYFGIGMGFRL